MLHALRKPGRPRRVTGGAPPWTALLLCAAAACSAPPRTQAIRVSDLERAAPAAILPAGRSVVTDTARLGPLLRRVAPALAMVQVNTPQEWEQLRAAAPQLGAAPDLRRGMVVGLVNLLGEPLSHEWPVRIEAVRVHQRAAFVSGRLAGGSYLPDGLAFVETAYVPDTRAVVMLEVNGVRYVTD